LFANGGGRIAYFVDGLLQLVSGDTKRLGPILDLEVFIMLILLRSRWSRLVRLSLMFLLHRLYEPLIIENGQQVIDRVFGVPRPRLDIASQDGLGFFYRLGYAIRMPVLHSLAMKTPVRTVCSQKEGLREGGGLVWGGWRSLKNLALWTPFLAGASALIRLICVIGAREQEQCACPTSGLSCP
jgi:hypothetical protein